MSVEAAGFLALELTPENYPSLNNDLFRKPSTLTQWSVHPTGHFIQLLGKLVSNFHPEITFHLNSSSRLGDTVLTPLGSSCSLPILWLEIPLEKGQRTYFRMSSTRQAAVIQRNHLQCLKILSPILLHPKITAFSKNSSSRI